VDRAPVVDQLVTSLADLAQTRLRALFVQPPTGGEDVSTGLRSHGFRPSTAGIAPAASVRIDLHRDCEDLHRRLTKANRRRTRNWDRRGVIVRVGSPDDAKPLADLLARTAEHQRFEPLSPDYIARMHRELDDDRHAVVFVAELDDAPVAALLCTCCNGTVKQRISGMDRPPRGARPPAPCGPLRTDRGTDRIRAVQDVLRRRGVPLPGAGRTHLIPAPTPRLRLLTTHPYRYPGSRDRQASTARWPR
jgi:hypothetical protein